MKSQLEEQFSFQIKALKLPEPIREFKFHPTRKWLYDFAWPKYGLMVEIDGGEWLIRGGHNSAAGMRRDREKDASATLMGHHIMRFVGSQVKDGSAIDFVDKYFSNQNLWRK